MFASEQPGEICILKNTGITLKPQFGIKLADIYDSKKKQAKS